MRLIIRLIAIYSMALVSACSGSNSESSVGDVFQVPSGGESSGESGGEASPIANSSLPLLMAADYRVPQEGASNQTIMLPVFLTGEANGKVSFTYSTSSSQATATPDSDYIAVSSVQSEISAGQSRVEIPITIRGDSIFEPQEFFYVTFSDASDNAILVTSSIRIDIVNDDTRALNDTGVALCRSTSTAFGACNSVALGTDVYQGQDAESGRDVDVATDADGRLGFSFEKLDSVTGLPLVNQGQSYLTQPWGCVKDKLTGLVWEVKAVSGLNRSLDDQFTWREDNAAKHGGQPGSIGNSPICFGYDAANSATYCNTQVYADSLNGLSLCGLTHWRLPSSEELQGLLVYGEKSARGHIDDGFFPHNQPGLYWTSRTSALQVLQAQQVDFNSAQQVYDAKGQPAYVRLVSDGL